MKRKILCLFSAVLFLCLCSCSASDSSTLSIEIDENDQNDFTYADNFFIPPTPEAYEYTFKSRSVTVDKLGTMVDAFFGDNTYSSGKTEEIERFDDGWYWCLSDHSASANLFTNGHYHLHDNKNSYSNYFTDIKIDEEKGWFTEGRLIYENEYDDTNITFADEEYTLASLSDSVLEKYSVCNKALGYDIEIKPLYTMVYRDANDSNVFAVMYFCLKEGDVVFRAVNLDPFADKEWTRDKPTTVYTATAFGTDHIEDLEAGEIIDELTKGQKLQIMSCQDAINQADEWLNQKAAHATLRYAQLEYTPIHQDSLTGIMTAQPCWALYYITDEDIEGVLFVDAQTGKIRNNYLSEIEY